MQDLTKILSYILVRYHVPYGSRRKNVLDSPTPEDRIRRSRPESGELISLDIGNPDRPSRQDSPQRHVFPTVDADRDKV